MSNLAETVPINWPLLTIAVIYLTALIMGRSVGTHLWQYLRRWKAQYGRRKAQYADPPSMDASSAKYAGDLAIGRERWGSLVQTWITNFDAEGPQPDRMSALMAVSSGLHTREWALYVRSRGGLAGATLDCLVSMGIAPDGAPMLAKKIALNMVQIGTVCGLPFDRLIERSLLCRPEELAGAPIAGGPLDASVNVDAGRDWSVVNRTTNS